MSKARPTDPRMHVKQLTWVVGDSEMIRQDYGEG